MYGDGIWQWNGNEWQKIYHSLPEEARQITALAASPDAKVLFVGTRRAGVWMLRDQKWHQHLETDELYNDNIQYLISFQDAIFAGTLEDGLVEYINGEWRHFDVNQLSSNAPRQMAVFHDALYVRHGNGMIDRFDGEHWERNVFPHLPRGKAYSITADDKKLYIGQWGGWSEWNGQNWDHSLHFTELQGIPMMMLHPTKTSLWIGTQSRGLARYDGKALQIIDERHGLSDDWITAIADSEGRLFAGTFVGGLVERTHEGWKTFAPVTGENVTSVESDGQGGAFVATRHGLWHLSKENEGADYQQRLSALSPEIQTLLSNSQGLWIGTRTGLYFLPVQLY